MPDDLQQTVPPPPRPPPMEPWSPPNRPVAMPGQDDAGYQNQLEAQQLQIFRQAKNVAQAEKDVASARRMLGILNADRDVASGLPVDKAIYKNLPLLVSPGDKGAMQNYRNLRPVPPPYQQNFQVGTNQVPAVITPGPGGAQRTQFIPRSSIPQPEFKASIEEIAPGIKAAKLGPNHYQLLERPNVRGTPTQLEKVQHEIWRANLTALQKAKGKTPDPNQQAKIQTQIDSVEQKMLDAAGTAKAAPKVDRVKVSKGGKSFTVPRDQLEQAIKEGYSEAK